MRTMVNLFSRITVDPQCSLACSVGENVELLTAYLYCKLLVHGRKDLKKCFEKFWFVCATRVCFFYKLGLAYARGNLQISAS